MAGRSQRSRTTQRPKSGARRTPRRKPARTNRPPIARIGTHIIPTSTPTPATASLLWVSSWHMRWRHALIPLLLAAIVMISRQQLRDVVAVLLRLLRPAARFGGQARANREQFDRDVHTFGLRSPSLTVDERKLKMRQLNAASPSRLLNVHMHSWASFQNASQPHTSQAEPWCDGEPEPVAGSRDPFRIYAQLFTWLEAHGALLLRLSVWCLFRPTRRRCRNLAGRGDQYS